MKIKIPATSANLGPGFDALGLSISLFNEATITRQLIGSISIKGEGSEKIGLKKNNTFVNIFREIYKKLGGEEANFRFEFNNLIPFSRGLGSSSAVIVGAIASAFYMANKIATRQEILNEAIKYENHPDNISPAALGGFVSSVVCDSLVYSQKADISSEIRAVVVIPDKPMNTKISRQKLSKVFSISDTVSNLSHAAYLTACFIKQDYANLRLACVDKMHEFSRMQTLPELFEVREIAYENGALMSTLSGSGSTFLNIAYSDDASKLAQSLQDKFPKFRVRILDFDNQGFKIIQS